MAEPQQQRRRSNRVAVVGFEDDVERFVIWRCHRSWSGRMEALSFWSPGSEQTLVSLIDSAGRRLLVENEELSASAIVGALEEAARRGVDVELLMTRSSEWDDSFDALVQAGVHVRAYSPSSALYIKVIEVDDGRVFLGSENLSVGSMRYNRE